LEMGKPRHEAEDLVEEVDKERIAFIKHYFNADWPTRSLYHLMINTVAGDENVIQTILNGMELSVSHPAQAGEFHRAG
jgi:cytidylate kinase